MSQVPVLLKAGPYFSLQKYPALKWGSRSSFKMGAAAAAPQEAGQDPGPLEQWKIMGARSGGQ